MLTLQASFGNMPQINAVIQNINAGAAAQGVPAITGFVTEPDLKLLIHSSAVRNKYPWLKAVLAREETYLQMAGLLGSGKAALGGYACCATGAYPDRQSGFSPGSFAERGPAGGISSVI